MRILKRTIQWTVGIICAFYLLLQATMLMPPVQRLVARTVCSTLNRLWDWNIKAEKVKLGLGNRIILDEVNLWDKQGEKMLHVSRMAAKIDILPLVSDGCISIANAQLFGTQARLYQQSPDSKPNFQFIIDTFKKKDHTPSKPLDLRIGSLLLRRVAINWDKRWMPIKGDSMFDPNHLSFSGIAMTAHLHALKDDSLNLTMKRLSFHEKSGLTLDNLQFEVTAGRHGAKIKGFALNMPHSTIGIPAADLTWSSYPHKGMTHEWLDSLEWKIDISSHLNPIDIPAILPSKARRFTYPIHADISANGSNSKANLPKIEIDARNVRLKASANVADISDNPVVRININSLTATPSEFTESTVLDRFGNVNASGIVKVGRHLMEADLDLKTDILRAKLNGILTDWNAFDMEVLTDRFNLAELLGKDGTFPIGDIKTDIQASGKLKGEGGKPDIKAKIVAPVMTLFGYEYHNVAANANLHGFRLKTDLSVDDANGSIDATADCQMQATKCVTADINIRNLAAHRLNLTDKYPDARFNGKLSASLSGTGINDLNGHVNIEDFRMTDLSGDSILIPSTSLTASTSYRSGQRQLDVASPILNLSAKGNFHFNTLALSVQNILHQHIATIVAQPSITSTDDRIDFSMDVCDTTVLSNLFGTRISIPEPLKANGWINGQTSTMEIRADAPIISYGNEVLRDCRVNISNPKKGAIVAEAETKRDVKKGHVTISTRTLIGENRIRMSARADNEQSKKNSGEVDLTATFNRLPDNTTSTNIWIAPSTLTIADSIWQIHPATILHSSGITRINGLQVSQGKNHSLMVEGCLSHDVQDSLKVSLKNIDIEYIMNLVNFHSVDFAGQISGSAVAHGTMEKPVVNADLYVDDFLFNNASQGEMSIKANWGDTPHRLTVSGRMHDQKLKNASVLQGYFSIGDPTRKNGMDLTVSACNFNLAFLRKFTNGILNDMSGTVTGQCRIYGDFKHINLGGAMYINEADMRLPMLGTAYHLRGDSVYLSPEGVHLKCRAMDDTGLKNYPKFSNRTGLMEHTALIDGRLMYRYFKDMKYDFAIQTDNILAYDFRDFGDQSYIGTVFTTGNIHLNGQSGRLTVDIDATPEPGTSFTYNVNSGNSVSSNSFVRFRDKTTLSVSKESADGSKAGSNGINVQNNVGSDLFINFNMHMTSDAHIRLLMDQQTGETIELQGDGHIIANYHNKGRFQMYGTYRTATGTYRLNVQDIIKRDFKFQPDGTVVFGGNPMLASLNLKAVYTVPNVSLDDLSSSSLGLSKTRVDCIMNLTGQPRQPQVTFDFDLPSATDDERQMVRSIVSTDEERNMQAIYLLGLGRFYSFSNNVSSSGQSQSVTAVNSLVSSTLSQQLNQFIVNATGTSKWNFGTNFKTGDDGWKNMDVEGMLSGSLFNDRLLVNGNFGYREKYYTQRNFITDVTVQYLLTKNGGISLKAYNQANDRYFVQSSLNTQGVGIQFKKDFDRFQDLFRWKKNRKSEKK